MNFSKKKLLLITLCFFIPFIANFIYLILDLTSIYKLSQGSFIINIVLMSYSFIASLLFLILSIKIKNYKTYITNHSFKFDFIYLYFPLFMAIAAWNILSLLFVFIKIIAFITYIFILLFIVLIGTFLRIFMYKKSDEFFIFNKHKVSFINYVKGRKNILYEGEINKTYFVFNDDNLTIKIDDTTCKITFLAKTNFMNKKKMIQNIYKLYNV